MTSMNTLCRVLSAAALAAAGSVSAISTNTLVAGAADWTSPTSYSEGGVPSAGDVIAFPAGTGYLENLFSCAVDYGLNARFYQWDVPTAFLRPTPTELRFSVPARH